MPGSFTRTPCWPRSASGALEAPSATSGAAPADPQLVFSGAGWPARLRGAAWRAGSCQEVLRGERGSPGALEQALDEVEAHWCRRRRTPGGGGLVLLLGYEALGTRPRLPGEPPDLLLFELQGEGAPAPLAFRDAESDPPGRPGVFTTLPRSRYTRAVRAVQEAIRQGEIYQANLTQTFVFPCEDDPLDLFARLRAASPAPRSACAVFSGGALVSLSPETFLEVTPGGWIETRPIKGTRPRAPDREQDRRLAAELLASAKDRAELVMIVDLERNDLGRVCEWGSVQTLEIAALQSFPHVHHLVGRVRGRLRRGVGLKELLAATFPGGSVTGAPKLRAIELLERWEPAPRGYYTGCLAWLGDDGRLSASLLIRTLFLWRGRGYLGAGGGIVADSDPVEEWREANHKVRPLARVLGFEPEEVGRRDAAG